MAFNSVYRSSVYRPIIYRGPITTTTTPSITNEDITVNVWYRIPYYAFNNFRTGIIKITDLAAANMLLTHDKIKVLNEDFEPDQRIYEVTDYFPAPYQTTQIKLQAINGTTELATYYTINLTEEPKGNLFQNQGNNYYCDTSSYTLPSFTTSVSGIIYKEKYKLLTLVNQQPIFLDTGDLWKYGLVSMLNIMNSNYGTVINILNALNISTTVLESYHINPLPISWRTKDIDDIYYELNDYVIESLIKRYELKNITKVDFVLYYLCETYGRLYA